MICIKDKVYLAMFLSIKIVIVKGSKFPPKINSCAAAHAPIKLDLSSLFHSCFPTTKCITYPRGFQHSHKLQASETHK